MDDFKISSKDNLYIEYNSLNKNYAELEAELNSLKAAVLLL